MLLLLEKNERMVKKSPLLNVNDQRNYLVVISSISNAFVAGWRDSNPVLYVDAAYLIDLSRNQMVMPIRVGSSNSSNKAGMTLQDPEDILRRLNLVQLLVQLLVQHKIEMQDKIVQDETEPVSFSDLAHSAYSSVDWVQEMVA
jgi:hypothetical protein